MRGRTGMGKGYKRVNRELVAKGAIIDYYQDTMEIPNGSTAKWDFIKHKGAAACVAVKPNGNLIMVRQYRNALERETIEIPAGGINPGEDMRSAALRELEEETGYRAGKFEFLLSIRTTVAFCNEKIDIYLAEDLQEGTQHLDEDEYLEIVEYPLPELLSMIDKGIIEDSKTICALLAYQRKVMQK